METLATETNPNSTEGEIVIIPSDNGMPLLNETTDIVTVETINDELTESQKQEEIGNIAKDSLFDGNGYSQSNGNGAKEFDEVDTTTVVVIDESKIDSLLPIQREDESMDLASLNSSEVKLRETLLDDLEKAQFYTVASLYYYIKVGKKLLNIKETRKNQKGSLQRIIQSVGLNERTAYRYIKIASDSRFAKMTEEHFKSLHHLTQGKMTMMVGFKDDKFYEAINDEEFPFPKKEKKITMGDDIEFGKDLFETFTVNSKAFVINEYNTLYIQFIELENKMKELEAE